MSDGVCSVSRLDTPSKGCFWGLRGPVWTPKIAFWLTFPRRKVTDVASWSTLTPAKAVPNQLEVSATFKRPLEHGNEALQARNRSKNGRFGPLGGVPGVRAPKSRLQGSFCASGRFPMEPDPRTLEKVQMSGVPGVQGRTGTLQNSFFQKIRQKIAVFPSRPPGPAGKPQLRPQKLSPRGARVVPFLDRPGDDPGLLHRGTTP